jgi:hypothetical protein
MTTLRFTTTHLATGPRLHYAEQGRRGSDHLPSRVQRFVVLLQPGAPLALEQVPRPRAHAARDTRTRTSQRAATPWTTSPSTWMRSWTRSASRGQISSVIPRRLFSRNGWR